MENKKMKNITKKMINIHSNMMKKEVVEDNITIK